MSIVQEFKEFAVKGNVMDLAVGVIIGGAFGKITTSLVEDVIMPVISAIMGGQLDFSNMFVVLGKVPEGTAMTYAALKEAGVPVLAYGNFITILINFIILAFIVFMLVKGMNKMRRQAEAEPEAPAEPSEEVLLLREISQKLSK
ncbi:Large-conductance mechanosensitive channel [Moraxella lacunata]|uniref:Large-conductance mechanosensitive channel n=3 Tax=Moraxella TaxID=475 RepID=A0A378TQ18_MORLA|nr:large conductance mechanosensitive channel protein MscL [Moraxella lacunata]STZ62807.1 Large-conductance mechanosensitive channel [Moraxella lacunata]